MLAEFERLIRTSTSAERLVRDARYASEKYADKLTADWGDQGRHQEVYDLALSRLRDLGHNTIVRLLKDEHSHRLQVMGLRTTIDRLAEGADRETEHDEF